MPLNTASCKWLKSLHSSGVEEKPAEEITHMDFGASSFDSAFCLGSFFGIYFTGNHAFQSRGRILLQSTGENTIATTWLKYPLRPHHRDPAGKKFSQIRVGVKPATEFLCRFKFDKINAGNFQFLDLAFLPLVPLFRPMRYVTGASAKA